VGVILGRGAGGAEGRARLCEKRRTRALKSLISVVLQTVLLMAVNALGYAMQPFHMEQMLFRLDVRGLPAQGRGFLLQTPEHTVTSVVLWDGVILVLAVYGVLLLAAKARKRPSAAVGSTIALVLALALGCCMGVGEGILRQRY